MPASNKPKKKKEESKLPSWFNEVMGIGLCGFGVLLFLALVSYTPADLPEFITDQKPDPTVGVQNWIGVFSVVVVPRALPHLFPLVTHTTQ